MNATEREHILYRWLENPDYQLFCGEEFFQHKLPFGRSSMTNWRQRMGEDRLVALVHESLVRFASMRWLKSPASRHDASQHIL